METIVRFVVRLPPELHAALVALAQIERRSINAQIVYMLQKALARAQQ